MTIPESVIDLRFTTMQEETPSFIYDELREFIPLCNRYSGQPAFLLERLAEQTGVPPGWIFLTNGVDEAIRVAVEAVGGSAHIFTPTEFTTLAQFCRGVHVHTALDGLTYTISTEAVPDATLFWLANPNNPVGFTAPETILALAAANPRATVIVDEIYGEFAPHLSVLSRVQEHENLVVCRGFSKSYGLPGIRLGYMAGNPALLNRFSARAPWANVSSLSCGVAAIALRHREHYEHLRATVLERRSDLVQLIERMGVTVVPSLINTITLRLESESAARAVVRTFEQRGILINHGDGDGSMGLGDRYVMFAVGTDGQAGRVREVCRSALR